MKKGKQLNYRIIGEKGIKLINRSIKHTLPFATGLTCKICGNALGATYGGHIGSQFGGQIGAGIGGAAGRYISKKIVNTKIRGWSK